MKFFLRQLFFQVYYLFRKPPWDTNITPPELVEFVANHPPGRALDLGCGTGTNAIYLAQHGWQVVGVDFVPTAILQGRQKASKAQVHIALHIGDVTRLGNDIQGPFDLILDIGCFHNQTETGKQAYIANLRRLLAPGGTFLLYGFYHRPGREFGIRADDLAALTQFLSLNRQEEGKGNPERPSAWFWFQSEQV